MPKKTGTTIQDHKIVASKLLEAKRALMDAEHFLSGKLSVKYGDSVRNIIRKMDQVKIKLFDKAYDDYPGTENFTEMYNGDLPNYM